jgi:hypothetical protein
MTIGDENEYSLENSVNVDGSDDNDTETHNPANDDADIDSFDMENTNVDNSLNMENRSVDSNNLEKRRVSGGSMVTETG